MAHSPQTTHKARNLYELLGVDQDRPAEISEPVTTSQPEPGVFPISKPNTPPLVPLPPRIFSNAKEKKHPLTDLRSKAMKEQQRLHDIKLKAAEPPLPTTPSRPEPDIWSPFQPATPEPAVRPVSPFLATDFSKAEFDLNPPPPTEGGTRRGFRSARRNRANDRLRDGGDRGVVD